MKNITSLALMAALVALLSSPSLGMAAGKPAKTAPVDLGSAGSFV